MASQSPSHTEVDGSKYVCQNTTITVKVKGTDEVTPESNHFYGSSFTASDINFSSVVFLVSAHQTDTQTVRQTDTQTQTQPKSSALHR